MMPKPVRLLFKLLVAIAVLVAAGFIYLSFAFDLNAYKAQIEAKASEAMGRPVHIMGDLDWGFSGFKPSVVVNNLRIGAEKNPEATLGQLSIAVPLRDLIDGRLLQGQLHGQVDLALDDLVYEGQALGDITAPVVMRDGGLSIKPLVVKLPQDGVLEADVTYDKKRLNVDAKAENVDYALIIPGAAGGDIAGTLTLTGTGTTIDDVLTGLNGTVNMRGGAGKLSGDALSIWADDVLSNIMTGRKRHTDVTCMLLKGNIKNGVLAPQQAVLDTEDVLVRAKGSIDLGRQRLKLLVTPTPRKPALISLATPVRVEGVWDNPSVTPDKRAVMEKLGGLVLGAVAPPAALLSFAKPGSSSSPCDAAAK